MNFDQYIQFRALFFKASIEGNAFNSAHVEKAFREAAEKHPEELKNISGIISLSLSDRLDNVIGLLDISKRSFLELALINALDRAEEIIDSVNPWEFAPPTEQDERDQEEGDK